MNFIIRPSRGFRAKMHLNFANFSSRRLYRLIAKSLPRKKKQFEHWLSIFFRFRRANSYACCSKTSRHQFAIPEQFNKLLKWQNNDAVVGLSNFSLQANDISRLQRGLFHQNTQSRKFVLSEAWFTLHLNRDVWLPFLDVWLAYERLHSLTMNRF